MFSFWQSLLSWNPLRTRNQRRLADDITPEAIVDLTMDDANKDTDTDETEAEAEAPECYKCPICMSPDLQDPVSTLCGHIFCSDCLDNSLANRHVCPLCNNQEPEAHRLYL